MTTAYIVCGPEDVLVDGGAVFVRWEHWRPSDRLWATRSLVKATRMAASWHRSDLTVAKGWYVSADEIVVPDVVQRDLFERAS